MGLVIEFIVTSIAEFIGWLVYDIWKEGRRKSRRKRRQWRKRNGPIDYG